MKKSLLGLVFLSTGAFGFGGVVTDPGSYTYYATQIETALKQLKQAEKQLQTQMDTYTSVDSIDKNLTGNLNRARQSLEDFNDLKEMNIKDTRKSLQFASKALDEIKNIADYKGDIEEEIDDVFGNSVDDAWVNVEAEKKKTRQRAFKQAIIDAETAQGKVDLQLENVTELAETANSTQDMKDAQDVTNALLIKMLESQGELITIVSNVSKNLALSQYDGGDHKNKASVVDGKDLLKPEDWKIKNKKSSKTQMEILNQCDSLNCNFKPELDLWSN